jgi:hypothetical protein
MLDKTYGHCSRNNDTIKDAPDHYGACTIIIGDYNPGTGCV